MLYYLRNDFFRRVGPSVFFILIVALTEIVRIRIGQHYTQAPMFFGLVMVTIVNGLFPGLVAATIMSLYAIFVGLPFDPIRVLIIVITSFGIVIHIQYLRAKSEKYDNAANIRHRLKVIHSLTLSTLVNWPTWTEKERWAMFEQVHQEIADIMALTLAWSELEGRGKDV